MSESMSDTMNEAKKASPLVEIEGMCRSFETSAGSVDVLSGLDLTIEKGDRIAIVGDNGPAGLRNGRREGAAPWRASGGG